MITNEKLSIILAPTSIPLHACILKILCKVINFQAQLQVDNKERFINLQKAVKDAIDDKAAELVHLTHSNVKKLLDLHNQKIERSIISKIDILLTNLGYNTNNSDTTKIVNHLSNDSCSTC